MTMKKPSNKKLAAIRYTIVPKDLASHLFDVSVTVDLPSSEGQVFALPAWIPGSYMIREFSRNIVQIRAESQGKQVALAKLDKHSWRAAPVDGSLTLHYEVYAWDLSVRAAHLDQTHGFFNGTSVFLRVLGQEAMPHLVDIVRSPDAAAKNWRVATSLPELGAKRYGFGTYLAGDYDELIDHPVEMGEFALANFKAHGIAHDIVITGRVPNLDMKRLQGDLKAICETQIAFFEPKAKRAPMQRYVFLTLAVGDGYGGLEHRASTALICGRAGAPGSQRRLPEIPGPVQPRVFPYLERQAHQAGRLCALRPAERNLHAPAMAVRRLYQLLRRPAAGARRRDRRGDLSETAGQDHRQRPARQRAHQAKRGRIELRRLGQILPPGRERAERHRQLLHQGFAGGVVLRSHHPRQDGR